MTVVYNTGASNNISVDVWGTILSQLGFVPLLYATLSFISRWYSSHSIFLTCRVRNWEGRDPNLTGYLAPIRLIRLLVLVAFVLSLIGGIWTSPDSGHIATAYKLRQAGDVVFILNVIIIFLFTMFLSSKSTSRDQKFDVVILQIYIVLPIMFVRSIYATVQAFLSSPTNPGHNIWVYLALLLIPDFVALLIYTLFGFVVPKATPRNTTPVYTDTESGPKDEMGSQEGSYAGGPAYQEPASSNIGNTYQPEGRRQRRRERRRGGPLHMLYYAIADRR
jgi:hypothetical protein